MAISQSMTTSFKVEILNGVHAFGTSVVRATTDADVFKIALYTSAADLGPSTTVYSSTNEVAGAGYVAGGNTLTVSQVPASSGTTSFIDFADTTWTLATITAAGALIYNSTQGNKAVAVLSFGGDKSCVSSNFTVQFPVADSLNAIVRID